MLPKNRIPTPPGEILLEDFLKPVAGLLKRRVRPGTAEETLLTLGAEP